MLQQATAFNPFVRELILSAQVARRASKHDIADVIRAATSNRDNMVSMVGGQRLLAPVALALLPLVLLLNLLSGMAPAIALYARAAFVHMTFMLFFVSPAIQTAMLTCFLTVLSIISLFAGSDFFRMGKPIYIALGFYFLLVALIERFALRSTGFTVLSTIGTLIGLLTSSTSAPALRKVFAGGRVFIATIITAVLGYNVAHSKGHSLLSRSGMLPTSPEHNNLCPYYSIERGIRI